MTKYILSLPRPIAIIGMGLSGESACNLLLAAGLDRKQIFTFDTKAPADFKDPSDLIAKKPGSLVVSPGVPLKTPWIQDLLKGGCALTSEINLGASVLTTEKVIGITGSLGKSTTTAILGEIFKAVDLYSFAGGNLGFPLCDYSRRVLSGTPRGQYIALELSSYQLENCKELSVAHSILTYLSPNHLERYQSLEHYYQTKMTLLQISQGENVVNENGGDALAFVKKSGRPFVLSSGSDPKVLNAVKLKNSKLLGKHNLDNLALAIRAAQALKIDSKYLQAALEFRGLSHRLEYVGELRQIHFVNDSKATALDSTLTAVDTVLQRLDANSKVMVLLGGRDKNLPWQSLSSLGESKQIVPVLFGECREKVASVFPKAQQFPHLKEAIDHAIYLASPGDFVLLSPGGTSMDEFKNFEERGTYFSDYVKSRN